MLRVTSIDRGAATTTLKLEGRIVGEWVGELRKACDEALEGPVKLRLDLADVTFVDRAGLSELQRQLNRGGKIVACSLFVSELLKHRE